MVSNPRTTNDYTQLKVLNHSIQFKDPETGANTNTIEGTWTHMKRSLPAANRSKDHFVGYLATFMLLRKWIGKTHLEK